MARAGDVPGSNSSRVRTSRRYRVRAARPSPCPTSARVVRTAPRSAARRARSVRAPWRRPSPRAAAPRASAPRLAFAARRGPSPWCRPSAPPRWFGMPALRSDWQPMMLRVRPAQFTTTSVSGSGARSCTRQASSAPGMSMPPGCSCGGIPRTGANRGSRLASSTAAALQLRGRDARRVVVVLDELAEGLRGHVDAAEKLAAGGAPAGAAAFQDRDTSV